MFKFTILLKKKLKKKTRKAHYFWLRGQIKDHTCYPWLVSDLSEVSSVPAQILV